MHKAPRREQGVKEKREILRRLITAEGDESGQAEGLLGRD